MATSHTLPDHDRCDTHRNYKLSCEQYEFLLARSGQVCEICGKSVKDTSERKLRIDHAGPKWAVRGLLCNQHNVKLQAGHGWFPGSAEYLARTWWVQECARLDVPTTLAPEPPIGSAIRDQFQTIWVREADEQWHPYGPGSPGVSRWTWEFIYERRGPQNMAPFDVYGPEGTERARLATERVTLTLTMEREREEAFEAGRADAAQEILEELTDGEREKYIEWADDGGWGDAHGEPQTEADRLVGAASTALNDICCDHRHLQQAVVKTLAGMPNGAGEEAMKTARSMLYDHSGADFTRAHFINIALRNLDDELKYPDAAEYLDSLPEQEHAEWITFALAIYDRSYFTDKGMVVRAAQCAQAVAQGTMYAAMCCGRGQYIRACPEPATYYALLADVECCASGVTKDHPGHGVCEKHLEQLASGTFVSSRGKTYRSISSAPIKEMVPF